ncbi:MAG: DUF1634 domain-containing protein [Terriglobales bacterium]
MADQKPPTPHPPPDQPPGSPDERCSPPPDQKPPGSGARAGLPPGAPHGHYRHILPPPQPGEAAANVYAIVYRVLMWGMFISTGLYIVGLFRALLSHQAVPLSADWVRTQMQWHIFWPNLLHLQASAILLLATVVLILTPVSRVVLSIYAFWVDHDRRYVGVTSIVFGVIVLTVLLSRFAGLH